MEIPILQDIAVIFGISIIVLFVCDKIHLPSIIGFLVTGALIGPDGFHLIQSEEKVEILAEIGVVLLMFTIGLELSIKELSHNKKAVLLGGTLQVMLTILVFFLIAQQTGLLAGQAIFIGFLVALSSTAIVLGIFQEKGKTHTPHGKNIIAILIFQDVIMVVMMLLIPLLKPGSDVNITMSLLLLLLKAVIIIGLVIVSTKYIIPKLLYQIAKNKTQDFFLLSIVAICLIIAWGSSQVGLSLGLGAFLAGLIISESEYSLRALGSILPFRGVFLSFFFVSVGTLFNTIFLIENLFLVVVLTLSVIMLKALLLFLIGGILRFNLRTTVIVGLSLSQIGEFSFMLSKMGVDNGLLDPNSYQLFLSVAVLSMALTPFLIFIAPKLADVLIKAMMSLTNVEESQFKLSHPQLSENKLEYHLVIIGYGVNGKFLAKAAKQAAIPYVIVEMDAEIVKDEQKKGEPIIYGDATHESLLKHTSIKNAFLVTIAISDLTKTRQVVSAIKKINPKVYIIARTHFVLEVEHLTKLGADSVIPVEFEAALEMERQMLAHFMMPPDEIERFVKEVRAGGYRKYIAEAMSEHYDQNEIDKLFESSSNATNNRSV
ncbi:cation:proton antiporter [Deltaproteobacteria bacterium TL4]